MIYRCWTKATTGEAGTPRRSANWALARRDWFKVFPDRVECGDWTIPVDRIRSATLYKAADFVFPGLVLELQTETATYQFGFNPWVKVHRHLPFTPEVREIGEVSWLTVLIRVLLVAYVAFLIARCVQ